MIDPRVIQEAVFTAIDTLNQTMSADKQVPRVADASLVDLDSLALTNLLVAVEDAVRAVLRTDISMTDEETLELIMSDEATPLRSAAALAQYVGRLVSEAGP